MAYVKNPTDKQQSELEAASFNGGSPIFRDAQRKVVAKGVQTATQKTTNGGGVGGQRNNAGVVIPHDDVPNRFMSEMQGKA